MAGMVPTLLLRVLLLLVPPALLAGLACAGPEEKPIISALPKELPAAW